MLPDTCLFGLFVTVHLLLMWKALGDNRHSGRQDENTVEAQTAGGKVRDKWERRRNTK